MYRKLIIFHSYFVSNRIIFPNIIWMLEKQQQTLFYANVIHCFHISLFLRISFMLEDLLQLDIQIPMQNVIKHTKWYKQVWIISKEWITSHCVNTMSKIPLKYKSKHSKILFILWIYAKVCDIEYWYPSYLNVPYKCLTN